RVLPSAAGLGELTDAVAAALDAMRAKRAVDRVCGRHGFAPETRGDFIDRPRAVGRRPGAERFDQFAWGFSGVIAGKRFEPAQGRNLGVAALTPQFGPQFAQFAALNPARRQPAKYLVDEGRDAGFECGGGDHRIPVFEITDRLPGGAGRRPRLHRNLLAVAEHRDVRPDIAAP